MHSTKIPIAAFALVAALALSPFQSAQAASLSGLGSKPEAESLIVAAKHRHRHASPGRCGEFMYWKKGHCKDARLKA